VEQDLRLMGKQRQRNGRRPHHQASDHEVRAAASARIPHMTRTEMKPARGLYSPFEKLIASPHRDARSLFECAAFLEGR
jgi:hypothetical protein